MTPLFWYSFSIFFSLVLWGIVVVFVETYLF